MNNGDISISSVKLREGGIKGLEPKYVKAVEKDGRMFKNE